MEVTSVDIFGITILEPSATATDIVVSAVCLYAFLKLKKVNRDDKAFRYFNYFFLTMSIATLFGGLFGHAFFNNNYLLKLPGWITSMFSISLLERASIKHAKSWMPPKIAKIYEIANIVELLVVMTITFISLDFFYVEIHSGFGMLAVILPVQGYVFLKTRNKGSGQFLTGVGIMIVSAIIFMNKISIHAWFDHLAISHTLMAIAAFIFYLATYNVQSDETYQNKLKTT